MRAILLRNILTFNVPEIYCTVHITCPFAKDCYLEVFTNIFCLHITTNIRLNKSTIDEV